MKTDNRTLYRELTLDRKNADNDARMVPASLSSEVEVARWFGTEVLVHEDGAVNLERAADGLPLLFNHDTAQPIGLAENVRLEGGRLRADLRFSNNAKASEIWRDVSEGFLRNISIGYQVRKYEQSDDSDLVRVTDWTLLEASVLSVPADASVGINRAHNTEGNKMTTETDTRKGDKIAGQGAGDVNVIDYQAARDSARAEGLVQGQRLEAERRDAITQLFAGPRYQARQYQDLRDTLLTNGSSIERAREQLLAFVGTDIEPAAAGDFRQDEPRGEVRGGQDELEKFREGAALALAVRVNTITDREQVRAARAGEFGSMTVPELAREYLRRNNVPTAGMARDKLVAAAFTRGVIGHSSSDFGGLLENVASKSLLLGYNEAEETWSMWCRTGNLPDFKQASRVGLSSFGDLDIVYENGKYTYGTYSDRKETLQLVTYGKLFNISRQALVNDDLDALGAIPRGMGVAANRKIGDIVYNILTQNSGAGPVMNEDSNNLFDATNHSNYVASSGAAPSVITVGAGRVAMGTQTDSSSSATALNIRPAHLLVPLALEDTANVLVAAQYDPAGTAGTLKPNPVAGTLDVVAEARLDADSATAWYLTANQAIRDTVEVAFLDGMQEPYLEQKDGWTSDGVEYKVRIDAVAGALDWRTFYKNVGA